MIACQNQLVIEDQENGFYEFLLSKLSTAIIIWGVPIFTLFCSLGIEIIQTPYNIGFSIEWLPSLYHQIPFSFEFLSHIFLAIMIIIQGRVISANVPDFAKIGIARTISKYPSPPRNVWDWVPFINVLTAKHVYMGWIRTVDILLGFCFAVYFHNAAFGLPPEKMLEAIQHLLSEVSVISCYWYISFSYKMETQQVGMNGGYQYGVTNIYRLIIGGILILLFSYFIENVISLLGIPPGSLTLLIELLVLLFCFGVIWYCMDYFPMTIRKMRK
uniref:Uncharacterized protein n=1 Tax=Candidatus Kentrum sp. TC TaxID=2126339 RepID=A0A450YSR5_9GAMM|nr:MAG: hypothetical protein BECKTC1821E_GA0114239_103636 [Candidatus Kentron sp. TC]